MTGQRRAMICRLLMAPPPGAVCWTLVLVDMERRVAGEVLFKKGHIALDWRRRASMVKVGSEGWLVGCVVVVLQRIRRKQGKQIERGPEGEGEGEGEVG